MKSIVCMIAAMAFCLPLMAADDKAKEESKDEVIAPSERDKQPKSREELKKEELKKYDKNRNGRIDAEEKVEIAKDKAEAKKEEKEARRRAAKAK